MKTQMIMRKAFAVCVAVCGILYLWSMSGTKCTKIEQKICDKCDVSLNILQEII